MAYYTNSKTLIFAPIEERITMDLLESVFMAYSKIRIIFKMPNKYSIKCNYSEVRAFHCDVRRQT